MWRIRKSYKTNVARTGCVVFVNFRIRPIKYVEVTAIVRYAYSICSANFITNVYSRNKSMCNEKTTRIMDNVVSAECMILEYLRSRHN